MRYSIRDPSWRPPWADKLDEFDALTIQWQDKVIELFYKWIIKINHYLEEETILCVVILFLVIAIIIIFYLIKYNYETLNKKIDLQEKKINIEEKDNE